MRGFPSAESRWVDAVASAALDRLTHQARVGPEAEEDLVLNERLEPEAARRLGVWLVEAAVGAELGATSKGDEG